MRSFEGGELTARYLCCVKVAGALSASSRAEFDDGMQSKYRLRGGFVPASYQPRERRVAVVARGL